MAICQGTILLTAMFPSEYSVRTMVTPALISMAPQNQREGTRPCLHDITFCRFHRGREPSTDDGRLSAYPLFQISCYFTISSSSTSKMRVEKGLI